MWYLPASIKNLLFTRIGRVLVTARIVDVFVVHCPHRGHRHSFPEPFVPWVGRIFVTARPTFPG